MKDERRSIFRNKYKINEVTTDEQVAYEVYIKGVNTLFIWLPVSGRWRFDSLDKAKARIKSLAETKRKMVYTA